MTARPNSSMRVASIPGAISAGTIVTRTSLAYHHRVVCCSTTQSSTTRCRRSRAGPHFKSKKACAGCRLENRNSGMYRRKASGQKFLGTASEPLAILKFDSAMSRSSVGNSGCAAKSGCPLYPRKRRLIERIGMSALCHQQRSTKSLVEARSAST